MTSFQLDGHKLLHHLAPLAAWQQGIDIQPLAFSIGPSRACNYRCCFCAYAYLERSATFLDLDKVVEMGKEAVEAGAKSFFFSGDGEPLLHPDLPNCLKNLKSLGLDLAINSNGSLLSVDIANQILPSLSWIRISVNAGEAQAYAKVHGTSPNMYQRVLNNLRQAVRIKQQQDLPCTIGVQTLLLTENLETLPNLAQELQAIGVDYLAIKPFLPHPKTSYRTTIDLKSKKIITKLKQLESLSTSEFKVIIRWHSFAKIKQRDYKHCLSFPFFVDIDAFGNVYPCGPHMGEEDFCYGNLYQQSWQDIWQGAERQNLSRFLTSEFDCSNCMPNCRNDAVNSFLWQLRQPVEHINFI